jgi:hypothetical protein
MILKVALFCLIIFVATFVSAALSFGASVSLPKTGQTLCYSVMNENVIDCPGSGQDAETQMGIAWPDPRYTIIYCSSNGPCTSQSSDCDSDSSNDLVTDNLTGLTWSRDAQNMVSRSVWSDELSEVNSLSLCGYSDWRMPNVNELESLFHWGFNEQTCGSSSCYDLEAWLESIGFTNVRPYYWTSTTSAGETDNVWSFDLESGIIEEEGKGTVGLYTWPVRGSSSLVPRTGQITAYATGDDGDLRAGVSLPSTRFTSGTGDESDCVTDNLTGLMWTKNANLYGSASFWAEGLGYANSLDLCGYTDWRLPNKNELFSLIDRSQSAPALTSSHPFTNVKTDKRYWTSTSNAYFRDEAWQADLSSGSVDVTEKSDNGGDAGYYLFVRGCSGKPVTNVGAGDYYSSISAAYAAAGSGDTILARTVVLDENLNLARNLTVVLKGGYDCGFSSASGYTIISGLTISRGTVKIDRVTIQ